MREVLSEPLKQMTVLSNHPPTVSSRRTDADCSASKMFIFSHKGQSLKKVDSSIGPRSQVPLFDEIELNPGPKFFQ